MEHNWKLRALFLGAVFVILAGDWLGLGAEDNESHGKDVERSQGRRSPTTFREDKPDLDLEGEVDHEGKLRMTASTVRADCLPKLVCELAGQPSYELGHKERSLLSLIRNSGFGTTAEVTSRWHFAAHMGQLLGGNGGCAALWPACPLPPTTLLGLSRRITLK